jgi:hypothetical protein
MRFTVSVPLSGQGGAVYHTILPLRGDWAGIHFRSSLNVSSDSVGSISIHGVTKNRSRTTVAPSFVRTVLERRSFSEPDFLLP